MVGLAGFVDAAAGGGGIISIPAYMFVGIPAHFALGCNKFSSTCGTTLTVFRFWKSGAIDIRSSLIAAAGSFAGSALGAKTALMLSDQAIKTMLVFILPAVAVKISLKRNFGEENLSQAINKTNAAILAAAIGFFIGGYDGLFGPGTGTFAIIAFSMMMKYDLKTASGNAKILNLASNAASAAVWLISGSVMLPIVLPAAAFGIAGNLLGARYAIKGGTKKIRGMIFVVLGLMFIKLIYDVAA